MESEPVEDCVQNTLSALYPPFTATAPTLLGQVFDVVEKTYREDALRYTLEFLVPAKHILARIQQEACSQYSGFVFCHEGWPLCLHEKIVVQLSSLPWQQLRPGDFYLQVVPYLARAPCLVLKCLAPDGHSIQELPVPPEAYPFLFTAEWLNGINKDRRAGRLERCLLAAEERVLRLPWTELICPQFVHEGGFMVGRRCPPGTSPEGLGARSPGDGHHSSGESREVEGGGPEGEYVQLLEISPPRPNAPLAFVPPDSQSRTLPARKGHNKGRNRRHRAWLHPKPGREETLPRNRTRRTWEGAHLGGGQGQGRVFPQDWDMSRLPRARAGQRCSQGDGEDQGADVPFAVDTQKSGKEGCLPREGQPVGDPGEGCLPGKEIWEGGPGEGEQGGDPREGCVPREEKQGGDSREEHFPRQESVPRETERQGEAREGQREGDCADRQLRRGLVEGQQAVDPGERQSGGVLREAQQGEDPGGTATSLQPNAVGAPAKAKPPDLSEGLGPAGPPCPGQREQSPPSGFGGVAPDTETAPARAHLQAGGDRSCPPAPATPHRAPRGNRRRKKWGGRGCSTAGGRKESVPARELAVPASNGQGCIPQGSELPSTAAKVKSQVPCGTGKESVPTDTGVPNTLAMGEEGIPESQEEGAGTDVPRHEAGTMVKTGESTQQDGVVPGEADIPTPLAIPSTEGMGGEGAPASPGHAASQANTEEKTMATVPSPQTSAGEKLITGSLKQMEPVVAGEVSAENAHPPEGATEPSCPPGSLPSTSAVLGQDVDWDLLRSGIFQLTGGMDRAGRAVLAVTPPPPGDPAQALSQEEFIKALRYLHSLLRKEQQELGLTVLLDLRQGGLLSPHSPALLAALQELQEVSPALVNRLLVLAPPGDPGKLALTQEMLVLSVADLPRFVEPQHLQQCLGGSLQHSQAQWVASCQALEQLCRLCRGVLCSVQAASVEVEEGSGAEKSNEELTAQIARHQDTMRKLLSDARLLELQSEGGALLARLCPWEALSGLAETASSLYQEVDNAIHRLVQLSNRRLGELEQLRQHQEIGQAQDGSLEDEQCLAAPEDDEGPKAVYGALSQHHQPPADASGSVCQEMQALALQNPRAAQEWGRCRARCQELGCLLQRRMRAALQPASPPRRRAGSTSASCSPQHPLRGLGTGLGSSRSMSCVLPPPSSPLPSLQVAPSCQSLGPARELEEDSGKERGPSPTDATPSSFFQAPTLPAGSSPPVGTPPLCRPSSRGPPATQRALSEPGPGSPRPGVHIRGLEVSSREVVDRTCSPREHVMLGRTGAQRAEAPWGGTPSTERKRRLGTQQHLVAELITLEQEYVSCLVELLPLGVGHQELASELRHECSTLQGLRDRLLAFHRAYFLKELQGCTIHPLRVGSCFLRYGDQFSLYALYVKSQQKLEAMFTTQRVHSKGGPGGLEGLWEDGGLARSLQRPLLQLEHYGRFLEELLRESGAEQTQEREALRAAQQLLESQEQHGRNLLAVEQIRGCEMDLRVQGQLLHRDEFTVLCGRRKCQRHIFLFEHLLLFSKRKGPEAGLDVFVYKQAFKTADMGLTENIGESGLRFELWFRRRKSREAYTLQAASPEVKHKWTSAVAQLLWRQATLSKELRIQEMVSKGIGDKPFLDIQAHSQGHLSALLMGRAARTRASVAVSSFGVAPCSPPAATSSPRSGPSPLSLFCDASPVTSAGHSPGGCSLPGHLEEEDWELDIKHIPRVAEMPESGEGTPAQGEPCLGGMELPGGSAPVQRRPRDSCAPPDLATPL
ncbi:rho guanine nucleotide exchange factor 40 isoform X2 [Alligator mississippiensis]|uniref:rho guanine nucleotide exchange factor 40 isoform X2 n=1 Tax=Alligator mississippiensis TaxID=8496 RepID=UPI002877DA12|nr:rho guanine nucleotide exchange factor 40 isoform X2 [Alligator mississippiensis]